MSEDSFSLRENRCAVCGWPLAAEQNGSAGNGCVRGNCSLRPLPQRAYDPARAVAEGYKRYAEQVHPRYGTNLVLCCTHDGTPLVDGRCPKCGEVYAAFTAPSAPPPSKQDIMERNAAQMATDVDVLKSVTASRDTYEDGRTLTLNQSLPPSAPGAREWWEEHAREFTHAPHHWYFRKIPEALEAFAASREAANGPCEICHQLTQPTAGNPCLWPTLLPKPKGNGLQFVYHIGCVMEAVWRHTQIIAAKDAELAALRAERLELLGKAAEWDAIQELPLPNFIESGLAPYGLPLYGRIKMVLDSEAALRAELEKLTQERDEETERADKMEAALTTMQEITADNEATVERLRESLGEVQEAYDYAGGRWEEWGDRASTVGQKLWAALAAAPEESR